MGVQVVAAGAVKSVTQKTRLSKAPLSLGRLALKDDHISTVSVEATQFTDQSPSARIAIASPEIEYIKTADLLSVTPEALLDGDQAPCTVVAQKLVERRSGMSAREVAPT